MKWVYYLYFFACSITLSKAQATDEGCITCAVGKFFETGLEDWILPTAAGALHFFVPDSSQAPDTIPNETDNQGTNNNPGSVNEPDIEIQTIASPDDKKCDPNGAGATSCAVATDQIIWPNPVSCGDEAQPSRILNEINRLAPTGRVRPIHNQCGTWFFTAALSPSQIQQLMDENIGIKFIEPDVEMDDDMEISSGVRKRQSDKEHMRRQLRVQRRVVPDSIHVLSPAPAHKADLSTPPNSYSSPSRSSRRQYGSYAYFDSAGDGATIYWIDRQFYMPNPDLREYGMAENRLMAEEISPDSEEWTRIPIGDHGGCMLSIIGGFDHGLISLVPAREDKLRLKIVRVNPRISSFFSGIQAIITELELRTQRNERVSTYTVIGTALIVQLRELGRMLQLEAAILFQMLTIKYQAVVVVSIGSRYIHTPPEDVWPATIAQAPDIPIIVVLGVNSYQPLRAPSSAPFISLNAPGYANCKHITADVHIEGASPAVAILTALAADMLTRPKVRAKLFIDNPALAPDEQKLEALRPVSAKIRDYLDSLAFYHGSTGVKCVWNGLDPEVTDINQYNACHAQLETAPQFQRANWDGPIPISGS